MNLYRFLSGPILLLVLLPTAHAQPKPAQDFWQLQTSAYTRHFSDNAGHNNQQKFIGLEYDDADSWIYGASVFRNSFDQPSQYAYVGKRFDSDSTPFYLKVSGGLLHGYRGEYKNKIPFNHYGVAPAIIPALGVHLGSATAELNLLGASAVMVNVGWRL